MNAALILGLMLFVQALVGSTDKESDLGVFVRIFHPFVQALMLGWLAIETGFFSL